MLDFIERYQQDRKGIKPLPRKLDQVNQLLKSDFYGQPYHISTGIKKGKYLVVQNQDFDEFDQPKISPASSLSSAISDVYCLIRKDILFQNLIKVDFAAKQKLVEKFPKKYHKLVNKLLVELFLFDPNFDKNCDLKLPLEVEDGYFYPRYTSGENYEVFAYLIYDNCTFSEEINHQGSELSNLIESLFDTEKMCEWATTLYLKEEIISPQQKWNQNNPEKLRQSDRAYKESNPAFQFIPSPELRSKIEAARLPGESDRDLLSRLLESGIR